MFTIYISNNILIIFSCSCFMISPLKLSCICRHSLEVILNHPPYKTRLIPIITVEENAYTLKISYMASYHMFFIPEQYFNELKEQEM